MVFINNFQKKKRIPQIIMKHIASWRHNMKSTVSIVWAHTTRKRTLTDARDSARWLTGVTGLLWLRDTACWESTDQPFWVRFSPRPNHSCPDLCDLIPCAFWNIWTECKLPLCHGPVTETSPRHCNPSTWCFHRCKNEALILMSFYCSITTKDS